MIERHLESENKYIPIKEAQTRMNLSVVSVV